MSNLLGVTLPKSIQEREALDRERIKAKPISTSVAVLSGVGCVRCGCRPRATLDDHCSSCREQVDKETK